MDGIKMIWRLVLVAAVALSLLLSTATLAESGCHKTKGSKVDSPKR